MSKPRIWISNATPEAGELVRVRALIVHRMESGFSLDATGEPIARNIVHQFTAKINNELLFSWEPETAISQNPYIEFTFVAQSSGELQLEWVDDQGKIIQDQIALQLNT